MIGSLRGMVVQATPEMALIEVNGVGYTVHIPLSTYYEIERSAPQGPVRLFIHTHLREDELALFGFWTEREKRLFQKLIGVGGIGPRLARVILSGMAPDDLVAALAGGEVARLTTIPGIGRKTAERMVLELREQVSDLATEGVAHAGAEDEDVISALVNLGYKRAQAEQAVAAERRVAPGGAFHELLRTSLRRLSRAGR